jgi:hypothetical protein
MAWERHGMCESALNVEPCHINQETTAVSCCTCMFAGGRICARYQILARRHCRTYCMLCARHRVLVDTRLACARTVRTTPAQLSVTDFAIVGPKVTPRIVAWVCKVIPSAVAGSVQFPNAIAFDFCGLSLAPVARS